MRVTGSKRSCQDELSTNQLEHEEKIMNRAILTNIKLYQRTKIGGVNRNFIKNWSNDYDWLE